MHSDRSGQEPDGRVAGHGGGHLRTAQIIDLQLQKATGWTTNDMGGTVIAFTGGSNKERTSLGVTTQVTQLMTGTATVTPGTRTLDTNPHSTLVLPIGGANGNTVLNASPLQNLYLAETTPWGEFPGGVTR